VVVRSEIIQNIHFPAFLYGFCNKLEIAHLSVEKNVFNKSEMLSRIDDKYQVVASSKILTSIIFLWRALNVRFCSILCRKTLKFSFVGYRFVSASDWSIFMF
jgi:hypothetical protein